MWDWLPAEVQKQIIDKRLKFYVVDAYDVARVANMGVRINTIMQTCFFKLAKVIPADEAITQIKDAIKKSYGKKGGGKIVEQNFAAVDGALASLHEVKYPNQVTSTVHMVPPVPAHAPAFVKDVLGMMIANRGDDLPVSAMPADGTFPTGTTQYEKRSIAQEIPIWDPKICTQCGLCSLGCPHATIRLKAFDPALLAKAPEGFKAADYKGKEFPGWKFVVQVAPDDCTGCGLCVEVCPAKDKEKVKHRAINMETKLPNLDRERAAYDFFTTIPDVDRSKVKPDTIKGSQLLLPFFEFSGACAGCGETPYVKLLTQYFGDRMLDRQRHGLLVDLWRQPPLHAVRGQPGRPRPVVVELAVRGLRRVWPGLPPGGRPAGEICGGTAAAAVRPVGRRAGLRTLEQQAGDGRARLPRSGSVWPS